MLPTQPVETIGTYAGGDPEYMQEPTGLDFANGVKPLDTLPAGWWNWLWNKITLNEGRTVTALNSIFNEILSVLSEAGVQPDAQQNNQIKNAIKLIVQASTGVLENLTTEDKDTVVAAINELNAAIGALSSLETTDKQSIVAAINNLISTKGQANGIASLDAAGRIPYSQLPESAIEFKGTWDASTNTPTLEDGVGVNGDMYIVSIAGTWEDIEFYVGDRIIYDGEHEAWVKLSGGTVLSVNGKTGTVVLKATDIESGTEHGTVQQALETAIDTATAANIAAQDATDEIGLLPSFTYVIYDQSTFDYWYTNTLHGNKGTNKTDDQGSCDFSRVLIRGPSTAGIYRNGRYYISYETDFLDFIGTKYVYMEEGAQIIITSFMEREIFKIFSSDLQRSVIFDNVHIRISSEFPNTYIPFEGTPFTGLVLRNCTIDIDQSKCTTLDILPAPAVNQCLCSDCKVHFIGDYTEYDDSTNISWDIFYSCNRALRCSVISDSPVLKSRIYAFSEMDYLSQCDVNLKARNSSTVLIRGYNNCTSLSNCNASLETPISSLSSAADSLQGFYNCYKLTSCYADVKGSLVNAFNNCYSLTVCEARATCRAHGASSMGGYGFRDCRSVMGCRSLASLSIIEGAPGTAVFAFHTSSGVINCKNIGGTIAGTFSVMDSTSSTYAYGATANGGFNT